MSLFQDFNVHEHPLIFNEEKNTDEEINRDHVCCICSLPILLSSFYSCSVTGCKYFLHEPCAHLPRRIYLQGDFYNELELRKHEEKFSCTICDKPCENLHYCNQHNPNRFRDHHVHPMCATVPMEIKSQHRSHPSHPLVAVCKQTSARCNACGVEQNGYFFSCHPCNFWIHVDCALLPRFAKCTKHKHPLILSYSIQQYAVFDYVKCVICSGKVMGSVAYLCGDCTRFAHLSCVAQNMEDLGPETKLEIIDTPFDNLDALWSRMTQNLKQLQSDQGNSTYDHNLLHDHGLILYDNDDHDTSQDHELVCCNTCIQPIYPPFYACPQSDECHFHLHQQCSQLPSIVKNPIVSSSEQKLLSWSTKGSLCSLFCCIFCGLPGNGLHYHHARNNSDIACLSGPNFIKHESHRQHVLYRFSLRYQSHRKSMNCCSVPVDDCQYTYACVDCDFVIHIRCAFLPKRVEHKFDMHPLKLITTSIVKDTTNSSDDYLCEFCEEDIDTRFWYYGCEECDNLFHIKCIPSVGHLSRVKFGSSIPVPCHPHRVTFVRMLGQGSQTCGYCKKTVHGFVDDMAFHCSKCDFWMHFECAEECTSTTKFEMGKPTILDVDSIRQKRELVKARQERERQERELEAQYRNIFYVHTSGERGFYPGYEYI